MRECGSCSLCCKLLAVESIAKPQEQWCSHCAIGHGCKIYSTRPQACHDFTCLWLKHEWIPEELQPNKSKVILYWNKDHTKVIAHCDPDRPDAWKNKGMYALLQHIASQDTAVVIGYQNQTHHVVGKLKQVEEVMKLTNVE